MDAFELPSQHGWPIILRYGALVLRPLRWRDSRSLARLRQRNLAWTRSWDATSPTGFAAPVVSASQLARTQRQAARDGVQLPWLLGWDDSLAPTRRSAENCPPIGQLTVTNITYGCARNASIGYWIDRDHAGLGLMPTAVAMASDYCFQVLRLHRLEICLRPENGPSRRVVEKLGFRFEGTRKRYLHIAGDWRDHEVYVMTEEEWAPGGLVQELTGGVAPHQR
ncbi:GNAT family N-acetyltransferase [Propionibacterium sp.]|uniref:GNAT family N-acetyltransferase n=1 Tax=Propionibacterium sp. TaxID=1977903 RepID=UPI0039ED0C61